MLQVSHSFTNVTSGVARTFGMIGIVLLIGCGGGEITALIDRELGEYLKSVDELSDTWVDGIEQSYVGVEYLAVGDLPEELSPQQILTDVEINTSEAVRLTREAHATAAGLIPPPAAAEYHALLIDFLASYESLMADALFYLSDGDYEGWINWYLRDRFTKGLSIQTKQSRLLLERNQFIDDALAAEGQDSQQGGISLLESVLAGLTMGAAFAFLQMIFRMLYTLGVMPLAATVLAIFIGLTAGCAEGGIFFVAWFPGYVVGFIFFKPGNIDRGASK